MGDYFNPFMQMELHMSEFQNFKSEKGVAPIWHKSADSGAYREREQKV